MKNDGHKSVIVLGAGLSGLYAAFFLKKRGVNVTVLEARNRTGGRIYTRRFSQEPSLTYEAGGEWIGKTHKRMRDLCRTFGLDLVIHKLNTHLLIRGEYKPPKHWKLHHNWYAIMHLMMKRFPHLRGKSLEELRHIDWWHYLLLHGVTADDMELLELFHSTDIGESTRFSSAYNMLAEYEHNGGDIAYATRYRINGGNSLLTDALTDTIGPENILLDTEVTEVTRENRIVHVKTRRGNVYSAGFVLCSLPAPSVSSIKWHPPMYPKQKHALESLSYARIIKTSVLFSKRFWNDDAFEILTDSLAHYIYHATKGQPGDAGILCSYATGDRAQVLSRMSDQQKIAAVCDALSVPFGDVGRFAVSVSGNYWADDPYARGAYAVFDSEDVSAQPLLRRPAGHILFAGEHTARFQGYMEGALESAERSSKQILYYLK